MYSLEDEICHYFDQLEPGARKQLIRGFGPYFNLACPLDLGEHQFEPLPNSLRRLSLTKVTQEQKGDKGDSFSEIIPNRLFLTSMAGLEQQIQSETFPKGALLVTYLSVSELTSFSQLQIPADSSLHWYCSGNHTDDYKSAHRLLEVLERMKQQYESGGPIVVHCHQGCRRSPWLVSTFIMYLATHNIFVHDDVRTDNLELLCKLAFEYVSQRRPNISFDLNFTTFALTTLASKDKTLLHNNWHVFFSRLVQTLPFRKLIHCPAAQDSLQRLLTLGPSEEWQEDLDALVSNEAISARLGHEFKEVLDELLGDCSPSNSNMKKNF